VGIDGEEKGKGINSEKMVQFVIDNGKKTATIRLSRIRGAANWSQGSECKFNRR